MFLSKTPRYGIILCSIYDRTHFGTIINSNLMIIYRKNPMLKINTETNQS